MLGQSGCGNGESLRRTLMDELLQGLKAAAEPSRLRLLSLCAQGEFTVSELVAILGQSQPRVSRHLKLLCDAGLLERFREGAWVFYALSRKRAVADLARRIVALLPENDAIVAGDRERLAAVRAARAERATAYFRDNAARWDEIRRLHVPEREIEQALLELFGSGRLPELLDIGTGTGRILEVLGSRVGHGLGIDISREMLNIARARLGERGLTNCEVRFGDMYRLPLPPASVNAVTVHQVLHFADDPQAAISEAARVLAPGGRLVVVDFAPHELEELRRDQAHRRLGFSDREVFGWFKAAGLTPERPIRFAGDPLAVVIWPAQRGRSLGTALPGESPYSGVAI